MCFGARQYASPVAKLYGNPQLGRFLSVDPLAGGSQASLSPYHAMGHDPVSFIDLGGTRFRGHPETFQYAGAGSVGNGWDGISEAFQAAMAGGFDQINDFIYHFDLTMQLKMQKVFHDKTISEWNSMLALHNLMGGVEAGIPGSSGSVFEKEGDPRATVLKEFKIVAEKDPESNNTNAEKGNYTWVKKVSDIYTQSTIIPSTALSFVEKTKYGRWASMGGLRFNTSHYSVQKYLIKEANTAAGYIKNGGKMLGGVGLILTGLDMGVNGITPSNSLDAAMGIISLLPGGGWIIGGIYFIGNPILKETTGKDAGQWINIGVKALNIK